MLSPPYLRTLSDCAIRIYKIPDGKPENTFAFSGEAKNKKYAMEIIHECHESWRRLIAGDSPAKTANYDLSMCVIFLYQRSQSTDIRSNLVATSPFKTPPVSSEGMTLPTLAFLPLPVALLPPLNPLVCFFYW